MGASKKALYVLILLFTATNLNASFEYRDPSDQNGWRQRLSESEGLKIFWWNLGCRNSEKVRNNLMHLASQSDNVRPHILILGEYCAGKLQEKKSGLLAELMLRYPHMYKVSQYTKYHGQNGLRVFSEHEIEDISNQMVPPGDWLKEMRKKDCYQGNEKSSRFKKDRYRFPLLKFEVKVDGRVFKIAGVHSPNPWGVMQECLGKLQTGWRIVNNTSNPNYKYAEAIGKNFQDQSRSVVIGDFNTPKKIKVGFLNFVGKGYSHLADWLGDSVIESKQPTAFSSATALAVDHAFVSQDLEVPFAEVIGLAGSNHVPLYIVVK